MSLSSSEEFNDGIAWHPFLIPTCHASISVVIRNEIPIYRLILLSHGASRSVGVQTTKLLIHTYTHTHSILLLLPSDSLQAILACMPLMAHMKVRFRWARLCVDGSHCRLRWRMSRACRLTSRMLR